MKAKVINFNNVDLDVSEYEKLAIYFRHPNKDAVECIDCEINDNRATCLIDASLENYLFDEDSQLRF